MLGGMRGQVNARARLGVSRPQKRCTRTLNNSGITNLVLRTRSQASMFGASSFPGRTVRPIQQRVECRHRTQDSFAIFLVCRLHPVSMQVVGSKKSASTGESQ